MGAAIYCSDFFRARQTAEIFRDRLDNNIIIEQTSFLRERFFGEFDMENHAAYEKVWIEDAQNSAHKEFSVESVDEVLTRVKSLINTLEDKHTKSNIILVSHGDVLQITQTIFDGIAPAFHRSLEPLQTAELRAFN